MYVLKKSGAKIAEVRAALEIFLEIRPKK